MSVGVKGLRVGTRAGGGKYVYAGRNGVYYRKSLSTSPKKPTRRSTGIAQRPAAPKASSTESPNVESLLARHQAEAVAAGIATAVPHQRHETSPPPVDPSSSDDRVEDLERQVEELQHQLSDAQKANQPPVEAVAEPADNPTSGEQPPPVTSAEPERTNLHEAKKIHLFSDDPVSKAVSRHGPRFMPAKIVVLGLLLAINLFGAHSKGQSIGGYVVPIILWGGIAGFVIWHQRWFDSKYPITLEYALEPGPATQAWNDLCASLRDLEAPGAVFATLAEGERWAGTSVESPGSLGSLKQLGVHVSHVATIDRVKVSFEAPSLTMSDRVLYFLPDRVLFSIGLAVRPRWAAISIPYADLGVVGRHVTLEVESATLPGSTVEGNSRAQEVVTYGEVSFLMRRHRDHEIARIHTPTSAHADAVVAALGALATANPSPPTLTS